MGLKCPPAKSAHKLRDFAVITIFVISNQQPFKFRHVLLGNYQQSDPLCNHIVISKNYGSPLVAIVEDLCFLLPVPVLDIWCALIRDQIQPCLRCIQMPECMKAFDWQILRKAEGGGANG